MANFNQNQIKSLTGNFKNIGKACGCTREYAMKIIKGQRVHNGKKSKAVIEKANELLKVLGQ